MGKAKPSAGPYRCPYCSKPVTLTTKGGLPPHLTPGAVRCVGAGMVFAKERLQPAKKK